MKIGVEIRIDVKKIEKARLYQGAKGTYLTMTAFIDTDQQDQYGNNGFVAHKTEQNEDKAPILGNSKVFWTDGQQAPAPQQAQQQSPAKFQQQATQQAAQAGFAQQQGGGFAPQQQKAPRVNPQEPSIDFNDDIPF